MPLTPVLPVNKNTLDKRIEVNLPLNNAQQLITAQKLQETLKPIVNSTFGLKTIWAGQIYSDFSRTSRTNYQYYENYYDPYYFPPVQDPAGPMTLNSIFNKYQVINKGAGLRVNGLADGSFTNIPAVLSTTNTSNGKFGGGITFDGTITAGVLSNLAVNNPGAGYIDGYLTNTYLDLQLDIIGGGVLPKLRFNMKRTIWPGTNDGQLSNEWWLNQNNVFIPNIENIFPMRPIDRLAIGFVLSYSDNIGSGKTLEQSISRLSQVYSEYDTLYKTGGDNGTSNIPGVYFYQNTKATPTSVTNTTYKGLGFLEIKVPIVYQPTVI